MFRGEIILLIDEEMIVLENAALKKNLDTSMELQVVAGKVFVAAPHEIRQYERLFFELQSGTKRIKNLSK